MRGAVRDERSPGAVALPAADKDLVEKEVRATTTWLDANQLAEVSARVRAVHPLHNMEPIATSHRWLVAYHSVSFGIMRL